MFKQLGIRMPVPIVDPHRHLGGSITTDCVWNIIKNDNDLSFLATSNADVVKAMTFAPDEQRDFHRFLNKFKILDDIRWSTNLIEYSIKCICEQLEAEEVDYCWLDFSINKYMHLDWSMKDAVEFIYLCFNKYRFGKVGLVLALKYESLRASQRQYAALIEDPDIASKLIGIDLVGDEGEFDASFYKPLFENWISAGKMVRAHVGESQSADNVEAAILDLGVTNIAHGLKIAGDIALMQLALDHDITFDMAITSNYLTGVWDNPDMHPILDMLDNGLKVTIGSDDPVQCSCTLSDEYQRAMQLGLTKSDLEAMASIAFENTQLYMQC